MGQKSWVSHRWLGLHSGVLVGGCSGSLFLLRGCQITAESSHICLLPPCLPGEARGSFFLGSNCRKQREKVPCLEYLNQILHCTCKASTVLIYY